jgi:hypothetical protein
LNNELFCCGANVAHWHLTDIERQAPDVGFRGVVSTGRRNTYLEQRDYVLMSEKCRQGQTAAEKPELWHRWQPGILKAIRRAFGKRYAGVASTG